MDQAWLLAQYAEIEAVKADIEGMKALNQTRIQRGESIAYDEDAFHEKALFLYGSAHLIMQNRQST